MRKVFVRFMQASGSRPAASLRYLPRLAFCSSQDLRARVLRIIEEHGVSSTQFSHAREEYSNATTKLFSEHKFVEGIEIYKQFIELSQKQLSKNHEDILKYERHLAKLYGDAGMWEQSAATLEDVAEIEQVPGKQATPGHIETLYQLEMAYNSLGRDEEAKKCSQKAAQHLQKIKLDLFGIAFVSKNDPRDLRYSSEIYSYLKKKKGKYTQSLPVFIQLMLEVVEIESIHGDRQNAYRLMQQARECLGDLDEKKINWIQSAISSYVAVGELEQAEKFTDEALRRLPRELMQNAFKGQLQWQSYAYSRISDLSSARQLVKVAFFHKLLKNPEEAANNYKKAVGKFEILAKQDPSLAFWVQILNKKIEEIQTQIETV